MPGEKAEQRGKELAAPLVGPGRQDRVPEAANGHAEAGQDAAESAARCEDSAAGSTGGGGGTAGDDSQLPPGSVGGIGRPPRSTGGSGRPPRASMDARRGWDSAKTVLTVLKTTGNFRTLRDLKGSDAFIDPSRLVMGKSLGSGAFAQVHAAQLLPASEVPGGDCKPQEVAVKTLRQELLQDPEQVDMFAREVALMRKLRHRRVVQFIGCSWQPGSLEEGGLDGSPPKELYYVQTFCGGGSLADVVRRQMVNPFKKLYSDADALRWSLHIAEALQYLHESRPTVVHRDLKLDNCLLTGTDVAHADCQLADFGLARLMRPEEKQQMQHLNKLLSVPPKQWDPRMRSSSKKLDGLLERMLTGTTASGATPGDLSRSTTFSAEVSCRELTGRTGSFGYMAPEVSRSQQYNALADIFSLGCVMHCLFCRTIPTLQIMLNGDESHLEMYAAKVADGFRPPLLPTLPESVKEVIQSCWKGDPALRPNARGVVEALKKIRDSGDVGVSEAESHLAEHGCACCCIS